MGHLTFVKSHRIFPKKEGRWTCFNHMGQSVVDHVITNGIAINGYQINRDSLGGSDHRPLVFDIPIGQEPEKSFNRWNVRKLTEKETEIRYRDLLAETKQDLLYEIGGDNNIDRNWDAFKKWVNNAAELSCGTLRYNNKPNPKFWTAELRAKKRRVMNEIENLHELVQTRQQGPVTTAARLAMRNAQVEYRALLIKRRSEVFQGIVNNLNKNQNAGTLMRYVKNCKGRRDRKGCPLDVSKMNQHASHFANTFGGRPMATNRS